MNEDAPLDLGLIGSLEDRFGRAVFMSFVEHYLGEVPERLAAVRAALAAADLAALRQQAHDLTTSSGTIGIAGVCRASQACEFACKDDDRSAAFAHGGRLPELIAAAVTALHERYPELAA